MTKGELIVVTGPSGVGKGTLVKALLENRKDLFVPIIFSPSLSLKI
jgi:guanylate kinase